MSRLPFRHIVAYGLSMSLTFTILLIAGPASATEPAELAKLVGQPADIASSAYQYRANRKADENPPESWFALMWYAGQPLNKPVDVQAAAIRRALCGLLWEEIRPVNTLELTWPADAKRRPAPEELAITTLDAKCSASSWWNNLVPVKQAVKPTVSADGNTYVYDLRKDTCGIVVSIAGGKSAADFDVPTVRVLTGEMWKKMDVEIEWGFAPATAEKDYSGRIETYDGRVAGLCPLDGDGSTAATDASSWRSVGKGPQSLSPRPLGEGQGVRAASATSALTLTLSQRERGRSHARRGVKFTLLYMGTSKWRRVQPFTSQRDDVARTIVTLWTKAGNFSFLAADLENGPILAPEYGFFVRRTSALTSPPKTPSQAPIALASSATSAAEFIEELKAKHLSTIRQRIRPHQEQTWQGAVTAMCGGNLPPIPKPPAGSQPPMQVQVPSERLTAQWNLGVWHLIRHCERNPKNGRLWFNDYPYGILGAETYMVLAALDLMGSHQAAEDGFDQWVSLPMDPKSGPGHHEWALPDRPNGLFSDGHGCLTHAVGPKGVGGQMDGIHAFGPGSIGWALTEHYWLTGDKKWLASRRAADYGQRRVDAPPAADHRQRGARRRTSLVQGAATGTPGDSRTAAGCGCSSTRPRPITGLPSHAWRPR